MRNRGLSLMVVVALVALAGHAEGQHMPRGTATDVSRAEVEARVEKTAAAAVSDQALRVVSINGEYNVGVGVVDRAKTAATTTGKYSGLHPAITALIAACSAVTVTSRVGTAPRTSSGSSPTVARKASTFSGVGGTTGRPSVQPRS